jgi:hypothetical protein
MRTIVVVEGEEMLCDRSADIISKLKKKRALFYVVMNLVGKNLIASITSLFS